MKMLTLWLPLILLLTGCLPQVKEQSCVTGTSFNSSTRSCVPITAGGSTSGIAITTRTPTSPNVTTVLGGSTSQIFTITLTNPLNEGYRTKWRLHPPVGDVFTNPVVAENTTTYIFNPSYYSELTLGLWTLVAEVYNASESLLITSVQWGITVGSPTTPTLSITSAGGTTLSGSTTAPGSRTLTVSVADPVDTTTWRLRWYYDGQLKTSAGPTTGDSTGLSSTFFTADAFTADDAPLAAGIHSIRAELTNSAGTVVYDTKEWSFYASIPNLPQLVTTGAAAPAPAASTTVLVANSVALNVLNSFRQSGTDLYTNSSDFCVAVSGNTDWTANPMTVQYLKNGSDVGMPAGALTANSTHMCLGDLNSTFSMSLASPSVGESQTLGARITHLPTGTVVATVTWNASVRPTNTAPVATRLLPSATSFSQNQGPHADDVVTYTVTAADDDTTTLALGVTYYADGVAMNGTNYYPGTTVLTPDCTHAASAAPVNSTRFDCAVALPTYGLTGRLSLGHTYTISVLLTDTTTFGSAAQNSNSVIWSATADYDDANNRESVLAPEGGDSSSATSVEHVNGDAATATGDSYIARLTSAGTPVTDGNFVTEGTAVVFNVHVKDDDRDNFQYSIVLCTDITCASYSPITSSTLVTRSDNKLGKRATYSYTLPETLVQSGTSGTAYFKVSVRDYLPGGGLGDEDFEIIDLDITNYNPFPLWAGSGQNPGFADVVSVVTGMQLTLDPGAITDASTTNGSTIQYQWQTSTDGATWANITGATARVLKWTPTNTVAGTVRLRLCLGDDGSDGTATTTDNALTICTGAGNAPIAPTAPATARYVGPWTAITARSNTLAQNATLAANGAVATSFDTTNRTWYIAYVNHNGTDNATIVVEKHAIAANGTLSLAKRVTFASEQTGSAYDAFNLSITHNSALVGSRTYGGLYVSYVTQSVSAGIPPRLRLRKLDVTEDDIVFDYTGVTESSETVSNLTTARNGDNDVSFTVTDPEFESGEYVTINGIRLTATTSASSGCSFQADDGSNTYDAVTVADNIADTYTACVAAVTDARDFSPTGTTPSGSGTATWNITNMPEEWLDLGYNVALGKAGRIMTISGHMMVPFLDNLNSSKVSVALVDIVHGSFTYGSLAAGNTNLAVTLPTVAAQDFDNSSAPNHAFFDVALLNYGNGVNAYRLSFTAPSTISITASVANVFGSGFSMRRPRIATGATATNNHVYILAEDTADPDYELQFARISAFTYTLASGMPTIPLDTVHEQTRGIEDYQITPLAAAKAVALAVLKTSGQVLVSRIAPASTSLDAPLIKPTHTSVSDMAGVGYPVVASGVSITNPVLAISRYGDFELGDVGATAAENTREGLVVFHPTATLFNATWVNMAVESFSATTVGTAFQPPFIK